MNRVIRLSSILLLWALISCNSQTQEGNPEGNATATGAAPRDAAGGDVLTSEAPASESAGSTSAPDQSGNGNPEPQANTLTAGEFDDALNLDIFLNFLQSDDAPLGFPDASVLTNTMSREAWQNLIPARSTTPSTKMEIALVLDVTGSMGDELRYLQAEWTAIIDDLKLLHPDLALRLSLVVYRDVGDAFVTASLPFTEDRAAFQSEIMKYSAGGGGDYPEAVDQALRDANQLTWGDSGVTKILFWLADAPPHQQNEALTFEQILELRTKGVSILPIAASGVAERAELIMRIGALITGGSYIFLTDDSGVGDPHAEPHIPCYHVERLNQLILRVLSERVSGQRIAPSPDKILRSVGQMQDGVCQQG